MDRWKFGVGQSAAQDRAEIQAARAAGLEFEYVRGQRWARMIEAATDRRRARHSDRHRHRRAAVRASPEGDPTPTFLTPDQVKAAQSSRGGWKRATLASWGVPWPPPKGWRRALEDQRTGRATRPHGWSGPVVSRMLVTSATNFRALNVANAHSSLPASPRSSGSTSRHWPSVRTEPSARSSTGHPCSRRELARSLPQVWHP